MGRVAVKMQTMAWAAIGIASAAGERGCLKAEGEAELTVGLIWADAFYSENRGFSANMAHEFNGGTDRTKLAGS
jgi:hypothetical protein